MQHTVTEVRLKNGARGLLIDVPGATVMSFQFQFRAGNRYVTSKDMYETAHVMEHMAFGANAQFASEHEYEAEFTKNGAYHNAWTSDLSMVYVADCADFEWERILRLQQVAITQPKFNQTELEAEKGNVRSELTGYLNDHNRVLWPKMQQLLGCDVYNYNQRLRTIAVISLEDIREHHQRTHTSENLRFVIAGKLAGRRAKIRRLLESWQLPHGERFAVPRDELHSGAPTLIRRKEASNLTFGWSMEIPRELTDAEDAALDCLNHILTGTMHSRILGAARKQGMAYGMFSDASVGKYESSWDFGGEVELEKAPQLFAVIVRELQAVLRGEITQAELDAAKSYGLGRHQMGAQTVAQISGYYSGRYFWDDYVKDYDSAPKRIQRITLAQMHDVARQFIAANTWVLAGVSSGDKSLLEGLQSKLERLFD